MTDGRIIPFRKNQPGRPAPSHSHALSPNWLLVAKWDGAWLWLAHGTQPAIEEAAGEYTAERPGLRTLAVNFNCGKWYVVNQGIIITGLK